MNTAEKLRFLADRAEDGKEFYIISVEKIRGLYAIKEGKLYCLSPDRESVLTLSKITEREFKIKPQWSFTEDEKVILRNVPEQYKWIARDEIDNQLYVYTDKPTKKNQERLSGTGSARNFNVFKHLFQSIKLSDEPCEFRRYL